MSAKKRGLDVTPKDQPVLITTKLRRQRDQLLAAINGHPTSRTYTDSDPIIDSSVTKAMQHRQAVQDAGRVLRSILNLTEETP